MPSLPFLLAAFGLSLVSLLGMLGWALRRLRRVEKLLEEER